LNIVLELLIDLTGPTQLLRNMDLDITRLLHGRSSCSAPSNPK